ncbi:MAG: FAD-dependent oxidoreductase [Gammaproteobacteria bacterium]|nr:FAD-dependent oxidoreductase [Gammaproteobacteria bacterium]
MYSTNGNLGMKIAVVGSGISGLSAAWLLQRKHRVCLYEAAGYLGGHTNTVEVSLDGATHPVDTGFLVHNNLTYPNLIRLFETLGVQTYATEMTFSVSQPERGIEWAGSSLATLFAQKRNLLRLYFWRMLQEIANFNSKSNMLLAWSEQQRVTLGGLLDEHGYSTAFRQGYLLPMAAAIWSSSPAEILGFPAATFLRFCINHRLLQIAGRPEWRSIAGGGRAYVSKMARSLDVRLNHPVDKVIRLQDGVEVTSRGETESYDAVILATHAPQSLAMLKDADTREQALLGSVRYQPNLAVLHTDRRFLPQRESLWSAWNYLSRGNQSDSVCVTYLLNRLQQLPFHTPLMVTLNPPPDMAPQGEIARFNYDHPIFDQAAIDAQADLGSIQGRNRTWFCGAWCGYGFHEDGLKSALRIIADFGVEAPWPVTL